MQYKTDTITNTDATLNPRQKSTPRLTGHFNRNGEKIVNVFIQTWGT